MRYAPHDECIEGGGALPDRTAVDLVKHDACRDIFALDAVLCKGFFLGAEPLGSCWTVGEDEPADNANALWERVSRFLSPDKPSWDARQ